MGLPARRAIAVLAWLLLLILSTCAEPPPPGQFVLAYEDERFYLESNDAPLADVISAIEQKVGVELQLYSKPEERLTAHHGGQKLEALLDHIGICYALTYERNAAGSVNLAGALLFDPDRAATEPELLHRIGEYIANLADDHVRFNALQSFHELLRIGAPAIPALEAALTQGDEQTRQMAAVILSYLGDDYAHPSGAFLEALADGMRDDGYPTSRGGGAYTGIANARNALTYLTGHPDQVGRIEWRLVRNLQSEDGQERFLSAVILAESGKRVYAADIARVLIPHLVDNELSSDAGLASRALEQLDDAARPYLVPYRERADPQQAELVNSILHTIDHGTPSQRDVSAPRWANMIDWEADRFPDAYGRYDPPKTDLAHVTSKGGEQELLAYQVLPGDTLEDIAKLFIVSAEEILQLNHMQGATEIRPGLGLLIPPPDF